MGPGVGTVAGGLVTQGIIVENMPLNVGPFDDGSFRTVHVSSIRRNKAACRLVRAQQSAALALDIPLSQLRRGECWMLVMVMVMSEFSYLYIPGMVAISPKSNQPVACQYS